MGSPHAGLCTDFDWTLKIYPNRAGGGAEEGVFGERQGAASARERRGTPTSGAKSFHV